MKKFIAGSLLGFVLACWSPSAQSKFEDPACVPGMTLAVGQLTSADHEQEEGYWTIGKLTIMVSPESLNNQTTLPRYKGDEVVLSIRLRKAEDR